jgi:hypothetical protein
MKAWLGIGIVLCLVAAAAGGYVRAQDARLREQARTIEAQGRAIGELSAANAAQNATIGELRAGKGRDDALVADTAGRIDRLATRLGTLDRRLQEALRDERNLALDAVLPAGAADALCLQWRAASGRPAADGHAGDQGNAPAGAAARAADTPAAGRAGDGGNGTAAGCAGWRAMTLRDAVEWNGLLLRHAGKEREDKAALRAWAEGRTR